MTKKEYIGRYRDVRRKINVLEGNLSEYFQVGFSNCFRTPEDERKWYVSVIRDLSKLYDELAELQGVKGV